MRPAAIALALVLALPAVAAACASCISSAYGDRTYNVAYIGLILTPFAVGITVGAIITHSWWRGRRRDGGEPIDAQFHDRCEAASAAPMEKT
jgi:hypothetical protein